MRNLRKKLSYSLYFVLGVVLFSSCDNNQGLLGWHNEIDTKGIKKDYKVVVIDSCEYIMYDAGGGYSGNEARQKFTAEVEVIVVQRTAGMVSNFTE